MELSERNSNVWRAMVSRNVYEMSRSRADRLPRQEEKAHTRDMWNLLKKYDVDQSGSLDVQELTNLIAHHAIEYGPGITRAELPSEDEILWILKAAGKYKQNLIHVAELELALQLWRSYVRNRARIEYFFNKYNTSQSDRLDFDQMKLYLTHLTGRTPKVSIPIK